MRRKWSGSEERYMRRALELARLGAGRVSPNPMVGAVLAKNGALLAEGYHKAYGQPHAEIEALAALPRPDMARGATLYVTLEPCCHHGKTPPCAEAIAKAGISRVLVARLDEFPAVAGRGVQALREAGVCVETGLLEVEATRLNAGFLMRHQRGRPFIAAKWAMSLDGRISAPTGDSKWISGPESRRRVHELRAESDAVLVGIGTVLNDNPKLNARLPGYQGRQPARVVIDTHLRAPFKANVFEAKPGGPIYLIASELAKDDVIERFGKMPGVEVLVAPHQHGMMDLGAAMSMLAERGMQRVLVEGGGQINGSLLQAGLLDEIIAFVSPKLIGGMDARSPIQCYESQTMADSLELKNVDVKSYGQDLCLTGYVAKPDALPGLYREDDSGASSASFQRIERGA